jgi:hypothetical protein
MPTARMRSRENTCPMDRKNAERKGNMGSVSPGILSSYPTVLIGRGSVFGDEKTMRVERQPQAEFPGIVT